MNTIMSFISRRTFASNQAVIENAIQLIARANATDFGLGADILAKDISRTHLLADQLWARNIRINSHNLITPYLLLVDSRRSRFEKGEPLMRQRPIRR